ncbi:hypothetical protein CR513_25675, partial [Mucuna pruriens]
MVWKIHESNGVLGYKQSKGDHTLFFKHSHGRELIVLLVYVDNIIRQLLKKKLSAVFEMKDIGNSIISWEMKWPIQNMAFSFIKQ